MLVKSKPVLEMLAFDQKDMFSSSSGAVCVCSPLFAWKARKRRTTKPAFFGTPDTVIVTNSTFHFN
jgi:hypothetical protein